MSLQVGRRNGRTTGPGLWGQNKKTPLPDPPWANEVSDVFVVGGATAVGYLCGLLSQICATSGICGGAEKIAAFGSSYCWNAYTL